MVLLMIVYVLEIQFAVDNKQLRGIDFVKLMSLFCLPFILYLELVLTDFSLKEPGSRYFRLAGHMVSVATASLCPPSVKAALDNI